MTSDTRLFGMEFAHETGDQILKMVSSDPIPAGGAQLLVTANVDHVVQLRRNSGLRQAYRRAWRRTIDGTPVFLYARLRGKAIPERVTGADLVPRLLENLATDRHRLYFVCATDTVAADMKRWAGQSDFPSDAIATDVPPFGFETDAAYSADLARRIRKHGTTHLFFGVGCPKSEIWIDRHAAALGDLWAFAIGASLSFFTGEIRRAPRIMRDTGLEWLWRTMQEPKRLARRYFISGWMFWFAVIDDIRGKPLDRADGEKP